MAKRGYTLSAEARAQRVEAGKARNPQAEDWTTVRVPRRVARSARKIALRGEPMWRVIENAVRREAEARMGP